MELAPLICRYAERFAERVGAAHHVGSPLGAWLVLALAAPTATDDLSDEVAEALGTDADTAQRAAIDVLTHPRQAVSAAAAVWTVAGLTGLDAWRAGLAGAVTAGPVPTQDQADAWAREHTFGLIEKFPLAVGNALILLASTLATKVTWRLPFEVADATELRGPWADTLTRVLRSPPAGGHDVLITDTERAGRVAMHSADTRGLEVVSVIVEDTVAPVDVLAAAHELAVTRASRDVDRLSLFDLPLGEHPLWTLVEEHSEHRGERVEALLPAWQASTEHSLLAVPALAFGAAGRSLARLARVDGGPIEARQTAVARYTRLGFEAAAVTGPVPASATIPPSGGALPHGNRPLRASLRRGCHRPGRRSP